MTREEAIDVIKAKVDYCESDKRFRAAVETLIPELAESEDERIRKSLIQFLTGEVHEIDVEGAVAYLEKQKPAEWSKDFDKEVENIHKRYPEVSFAKLTRIAYHFSKWASSYKDIEWSEENEKMIGQIVLSLQSLVDEGIHSGFVKQVRKEQTWLKERLKYLRPQPKQEWSEEDDRNIKTIVSEIEKHHNDYDCIYDTIRDEYPISAKELVQWLKSLKNRLTWKPSAKHLNNEQ